MLFKLEYPDSVDGKDLAKILREAANNIEQYSNPEDDRVVTHIVDEDDEVIATFTISE